MFSPREMQFGPVDMSLAAIPYVPGARYQLAGARQPIPRWRGLAKRAIDIVLATAALLAFAIPVLISAIAIKLDSPGPVLFRQRRVGLGGHTFELWKLRTMHCATNEDALVQQTQRQDPRVTRVGAFLRQTSLDEIPQFVQVLRGDMSIVGPRPHAPGTCAGGTPFEQITAQYGARHRVRPGLTGLAQVRGLRGATETEAELLQRLDSDLEYIANWSLRTDLSIIARTIGTVLCMRNAY